MCSARFSRLPAGSLIPRSHDAVQRPPTVPLAADRQPRRRFHPGWLAVGWLIALAGIASARGVAGTAPDTEWITVAELLRRVVARNEAVQGKLLEFESNRRRQAAEAGVFEPEGFLTFARETTHRQNSTREAAAVAGASLLQERNNLYASGVELFVPSGARIRMGYTVSDLYSNIPPSLFQPPAEGDQFQSFAGISLTQPLLKNGGRPASMAAIRLAALSSNIAFQEYRRQLMSLVGTAEAAYWTLHLAQEQVRFFEESLRMAETILRDNRARLDAGKVSELDVLEAQAGVGLRRAKLNDAQQKLVETISRVVTLYGERTDGLQMPVRAGEVPAVAAVHLRPDVWREQAFVFNPDFLIQREKLHQELVRLAYARNQRLPEVNLKGAYGLNGLGETPADSFRIIERAGYASWSVGVEVRVPLMGGTKVRNEEKAAELRRRTAELAIRSLETDLLNGIDTAAKKVEHARSSVESYRASVDYNQSVLASALARLEAGKIESRKVLEIEADLFEAKNSVVESLVRYKVAGLELELIAGTLLQERGLEITQKQLQSATERLGRSRRPGEASDEAARQQISELYPMLNPNPPSRAQRPASLQPAAGGDASAVNPQPNSS